MFKFTKTLDPVLDLFETHIDK